MVSRKSFQKKNIVSSLVPKTLFRASSVVQTAVTCGTSHRRNRNLEVLNLYWLLICSRIWRFFQSFCRLATDDVQNCSIRLCLHGLSCSLPSRIVHVSSVIGEAINECWISSRSFGSSWLFRSSRVQQRQNRRGSKGVSSCNRPRQAFYDWLND